MQRILHLLQKSIIPLLAGVLVFVIGATVSNGVMGGGDSFAHYLIAKYSWLHYHLFFDHWGKPLFTILSSPFAQLGLKGVTFFNVCCGVLSSVLVYLILRKEQLPSIAVFALLLAPYFTSLHVSGLTEPLFTSILTGQVYFMLRKNWIFAALCAGSLVLVRTEGILFIGMLGAQLLVMKQFKSLLILLVPVVTISLVGAVFYEGNVFWFYTEMPYSVQSFYDSGSLFHFIENADIIFGLPILVFSLIGFLVLLSQWKENIYKLIPLLSFPVVYITFHSVLFGFGLGASAGLKRVLIVITPVLIILCGVALKEIGTRFPKAYVYVLTGFSLFVIINYASSNRIPVWQSNQELALEEMVSKIHESEVQKVCYFHPAYPVFAGCDPFTKTHCVEGWPSIYRKGDVVVWDSHFGPNEGRTAYNDMMANQDFELIEKVEVDYYTVATFQCIKDSK